MKNLEFLLNNLIAHRGVHYKYRENTIEAFNEAIKGKYIIELDIRLTKDNVIVVFHDYNIFRLTGIYKKVSNLTYKELKNIINVPTLEEVLSLVNGKVPIVIEIKFNKQIGKIEKMVSEVMDKYKYEFAIQSFNPITIFWFKIKRNSYVRGYLVNNIINSNLLLKIVLNNRLVNKILNPDYIGIDKDELVKNYIKKLRKKYFIIGYTINNSYEYNKYKEYADNFICNIEKEPYK